MRSPAVVLLAFVLALVIAVAALPSANPPNAEAELVAPLASNAAAKTDANPERVVPCRTWCRWQFGEYICTNPCWQ
ncbi:hypothetical protein BCR44DRAFT_35947 [Catenaria anguillulae PL171]|uniref:Uncharacterized protein n=1 Tax=Catenaria anguillulae PL171 TaxID=765915 RepID=A0A1Y2HF27_9FUNG|nr:hypothetical protein BCR44DRAFT_35947 [Catenaria anguillulae PL171]